MSFKKSLLAIAISTTMLSACNQEAQTTKTAEPAKQETQAVSMSESEKANQLFDQLFNEGVKRSPMMQTYLGMKTDYDKWDDISQANEARELEITKENLAKVKAIDVSKLDYQTTISHRLLVQSLENDIADYQWRFHNYPVNQMFGIHSQVPAFLINQHLSLIHI